MLSQSLIAVFKSLAEFHGYVPVQAVAPVQPEHAAQSAPPVPSVQPADPKALCCV